MVNLTIATNDFIKDVDNMEQLTANFITWYIKTKRTGGNLGPDLRDKPSGSGSDPPPTSTIASTTATTTPVSSSNIPVSIATTGTAFSSAFGTGNSNFSFGNWGHNSNQSNNSNTGFNFGSNNTSSTGFGSFGNFGKPSSGYSAFGGKPITWNSNLNSNSAFGSGFGNIAQQSNFGTGTGFGSSLLENDLPVSSITTPINTSTNDPFGLGILSYIASSTGRPSITFVSHASQVIPFPNSQTNSQTTSTSNPKPKKKKDKKGKKVSFTRTYPEDIFVYPVTGGDSGNHGRWSWNQAAGRYVSDPNGIMYSYDPNSRLVSTQSILGPDNNQQQPDGTGNNNGNNNNNNGNGNIGGIGGDDDDDDSSDSSDSDDDNAGGGSGGGSGNSGNSGNPRRNNRNNRNTRNNDYSNLDPNIAALANAVALLATNNSNSETGGTFQHELNIVRPNKFSGKESEDPVEWIEQFNRAADANNWDQSKRTRFAAAYLTDNAANWYETAKTTFIGWTGTGHSFTSQFLAKFASTSRINDWYIQFKRCKQNGRAIDEYITEWNAWKHRLDRQNTMPEATAAADFTMGLDADIMMFVQSMGPRTVQDAQRIAHNIYEGKKVAGHIRQTYAMETEVAAKKESVMANNQLMNQLINPIVTQQMPPLQVQQPDQWNRVASDKTSGINNSRKGRPQFQSKKNMSEIICFKCGEKGHIRKDCLGERDLQAERNNYFEQRNQRNAQVNNIEDTSEVNHIKRVAIPVVPRYNLPRDMFNHGVSLTFADMLQESHYRKQV